MTTPSSDMTVGVVGLGKMGGAMARRLATLGQSVVGFDVAEAARSEAATHGVQLAESVAHLAELTDVAVLSLPTPAIVRDTVVGSDGLLVTGGLRYLVDCSTTGYGVSVEIGQASADAGVEFVDAPVSGGVAGATNGTLTIMVSAPEAVFQSSLGLLESIGKKIFHVGTSPGLGQVMKLVNNMISSVAMVATAEGMVVGTRAGLDPATMLEVLNASSGRNSHTEEKFPRHVLPRTFDFGFSMNLLHKDVTLGLEMAQRMGIPMIVTSNASQVWSLAMAEGGTDLDMTAIVQHLERWAAVEISNDSMSRKEHE